MTKARDAPSIPEWNAAPMGASLTEVFGDGSPDLAGAFERFYSSSLRHLRVSSVETLRAVDRIARRDRRRLGIRDRCRLDRLRAHALASAGRPADAHRTYRRVWSRQKSLGDRRELCVTGIGWIGALNELGRHHAASRLAATCRRLLPAKETILRARIDANDGGVMILLCRYEAAIDVLRSARRRFRRAGHLADAAFATVNLGLCSLMKGRTRQARRFYAEAAREFDGRGFTSLRLLAEAGLSLADLVEGKWSEVSESLERIVRELEAIGDVRNVVFVQHQQAEFLHAVGAPEPAEALAARALERARDLHATYDVAEIRFLHARILAALERYVDARVQLDRALEHWTRERHAWAAHRINVELGAVVLARGDPREALRILRRSSLYLSRRDREGSGARCTHLRAACQLRLGHPGQAARLAGAAYREASLAPARFERPWIAATLACAFAAGGRDKDAIRWARRSIGLIEALYFELGTRSMRGHLSGSREKLHREAVNLALSIPRRDSARVALDFITRARSPQLVEDLIGRRPRLGDSVRLAIARLRNEFLGGPSNDDRDARGANLREEMAELDSVLGRRKGGGSEIVRRAIERRGLDSWLAMLGGRSLVLYESSASGYAAYVVNAARQVEHVRLPTGRDAIEELWMPARMTLEQASHLDSRERAGFLDATTTESTMAFRELRAHLWDPLDVPGGRVVLVPGGDLHGVPLEAIVECADGAHDASWSIARWPHPSLLDRGARRTRRRALLLHDGEPARRRETSRIEGILRREGFHVEVASSRGDFARPRNALGALHIAAHGAFHRPRWMLNGIRVPDGWIGFEQLDRPELRGALVFFGSCESGLQGEVPGSEFDGWMSAALGAGAREILLTLWKIDDASAARFSSSFYAHWAKGATAPAAAAAARRKIRVEQPHPYAWAPFVALG